MKKLTIYDIAKLAGVSKSTVSRFLNDGYVSQSNREKIEKIIEENNFKRSDSAVSLRTKENQTIGVIIPRIDSYTASNVVKGILQTVSKYDFNSEILTSDLKYDNELAAYIKLKERNVKGIIALATNMTPEYEAMLSALGIPVVIFGQQCEVVSCVYNDVESAVREFCSLLYPNSYYSNHKVLLLGPDTQDRMLTSTIETYQKTLESKGIIVHRLVSGYSWKSSYILVEKALTYSNHIICLTDNIAYGVYKYAQQKGLIIGRDIHISGNGGYDTSSILTPELSTIAYPYFDAGIKTVKLLINQDTVTQIKLGYTLTKTNSFSA